MQIRSYRELKEVDTILTGIEAGSFYEISNGNYSQIPYYGIQYIGGDVDDW